MSVALALIPVFGLILLGHALYRMGFPSASFWPDAERLTYFLLFPLLLIYQLSEAERGAVNLEEVAVLVITTVLVMSLAFVMLQRIVGWQGPVFTSIFQGGMRFNSYIGLAAVTALWGGGLIPWAAVIFAVMIPALNLLCVLCFALYTRQGQIDWRGVFNTIMRNPLIIGCVIGIAFNLTGLRLPSVIVGMLQPLSSMALALGLMTVGAGLQLAALRSATQPFIVATTIKFVVFPVVALLIGKLTASSLPTVQVFVLMTALPTATSSYILSRQLGGDSSLMAAIVSGQTLLGIVTIPLTMAFMAPLWAWFA